MTTPAAPANPVGEAFNAALRHDAAVAPPTIPGPPRTEPRDPEAPHGRDSDGKPLTPFGIGKNGLPRIKAATPGAGRPRRDKDAARVDDAPDDRTKPPPGAEPGADAGKKDYTEDLTGFAVSLWMGAAPFELTAPYAHVWKRSYPGMVKAWNQGAQSNKTIRQYAEKISGEGSWAWVIAAALTSAQFAAAVWELSKPIKDPVKKAERDKLKKEYAAASQDEFKKFLEENIEAILEEAAGDSVIAITIDPEQPYDRGHDNTAAAIGAGQLGAVPGVDPY